MQRHFSRISVTNREMVEKTGHGTTLLHESLKSRDVLEQEI